MLIMDSLSSNASSDSLDSIEKSRELLVIAVDNLRAINTVAYWNHPLNVLSLAYDEIVEMDPYSSDLLSLSIAVEALRTRLTKPDALTIHKTIGRKLLRFLESMSGDGASFVNQIEDTAIAWDLAQPLLIAPITRDEVYL
jgi:hypothetical protein